MVFQEVGICSILKDNSSRKNFAVQREGVAEGGCGRSRQKMERKFLVLLPRPQGADEARRLVVVRIISKIHSNFVQYTPPSYAKASLPKILFFKTAFPDLVLKYLSKFLALPAFSTATYATNLKGLYDLVDTLDSSLCSASLRFKSCVEPTYMKSLLFDFKMYTYRTKFSPCGLPHYAKASCGLPSEALA